jgi:hypothetical protein
MIGAVQNSLHIKRMTRRMESFILLRRLLLLKSKNIKEGVEQ